MYTGWKHLLVKNKIGRKQHKETEFVAFARVAETSDLKCESAQPCSRHQDRHLWRLTTHQTQQEKQQ